MCQVFGDHWGYTARDLNYKSVASIIEDLCISRRFGSNFLLNVGPMGDGNLRSIDKAMLEIIGTWMQIYNESIYAPRPSGIEIKNRQKDFILHNENEYYLFVHDIPMVADPNVAISKKNEDNLKFDFNKKITSLRWLDNNSELKFKQQDGKVIVEVDPFQYGENLVVRVAKLSV